MCIILDANLFKDYIEKSPDMKPVWRWLEGPKRRGKLAYSPTAKFEAEVGMHRCFKKKLADLRRAGRLKQIPAAKVTETESGLPPLKSDDSHIVALAIAGKISVLVSLDQALHADFKELVEGGKVYQNATHKHLLTPDLCD